MGRCFFRRRLKKWYVSMFYASQRNKLQQSTYLIQYYILQTLHSFATRGLIFLHLFYTSSFSKCFYNKTYSSLRTFSATSFSSLLTTSSIMDLVMLMMSNDSFISGSARGSYSYDGGDSSAVVGKLLIRSLEASTEAKNQKQYLCAFHARRPLQLALLFPERRGCLSHSFL
jgi:hypothetical protein